MNAMASGDIFMMKPGGSSSSVGTVVFICEGCVRGVGVGVGGVGVGVGVGVEYEREGEISISDSPFRFVL